MTSFLQTPDGDIAIPNGRAVLVSGATEKAQKIRNRLRLFKGEWFLNTKVGIPYWEKIIGVGKNPDLEIVRLIFRRAILAVEGIVDVTIELSLNAKRELSWSFVATSDDGKEITGDSSAYVDSGSS